MLLNPIHKPYLNSTKRWLALVLLSCLMQACSMPVFTPGTYIKKVAGPEFAPMMPSDSRNAMLYVYRPDSQWGAEEMEAPTLVVNGKRVAGLKTGQYIWFELYAGNATVEFKRSVLGINLRKVETLQVDLKGSGQHFVRYAERENGADGSGLVEGEAQQTAVVQEVDPQIALQEIAHLRMDQPGLFLACQGDSKAWRTFEKVNEDKIPKSCEVTEPIIPSVPATKRKQTTTLTN